LLTITQGGIKYDQMTTLTFTLRFTVHDLTFKSIIRG
jgi:hypothetical protein